MNKKVFWNKKIIGWEHKRYSNYSSIYARMMKTLEIVKNLPDNITILEVGCGSGILAEQIMKTNKKVNYIGIDISNIAINHANERGISKQNNVKFLSMSISDVEDYLQKNNINIDCVISLGVWDWLSTDERDILLKLSINKYIHSYSSENNLLKWFHKIYVFFAYGFKDINYIPKYDDDKKMLNLFKNSRIEHDKRMNIGKIVTNV